MCAIDEVVESLHWILVVGHDQSGQCLQRVLLPIPCRDGEAKFLLEVARVHDSVVISVNVLKELGANRVRCPVSSHVEAFVELDDVEHTIVAIVPNLNAALYLITECETTNEITQTQAQAQMALYGSKYHSGDNNNAILTLKICMALYACFCM